MNNNRVGKGKLIYRDSTIYEGDFVNDVREGKGILIYPNGSV